MTALDSANNLSDVASTTTSLSNLNGVPKTTTINGHTLNANIVLTTGDIAIVADKNYVDDDEKALLDAAGEHYQSYVCTVGCGSGTLTSASADAYFIQIGSTCLYTINITITNKGTAGGYISATLPAVCAPRDFIGTGREIGITGHTVNCFVLANTSEVVITDLSNNYIGSNGYVLSVTGFYELAF